jgi:nucleotide-binding universal stress UspA family protein
MLLGSVSAKILHDAEMPVLSGLLLEIGVVDRDIHIRQVLCALDYDERGFAALRAASLVAREFGAKLTAVHARHGEDAQGKPQRERSLQGERQARELIAGLGIDCELLVEIGQPPAVVSQAAKRLPADIIVIGRSEPTPVGRLKSQAYGIIRDSPCPVLSV